MVVAVADLGTNGMWLQIPEVVGCVEREIGPGVAVEADLVAAVAEEVVVGNGEVTRMGAAQVDALATVVDDAVAADAGVGGGGEVGTRAGLADRAPVVVEQLAVSAQALPPEARGAAAIIGLDQQVVVACAVVGHGCSARGACDDESGGDGTAAAEASGVEAVVAHVGE